MYIIIGRTGCPYTERAKILVKTLSHKYYEISSSSSEMNKYLQKRPSLHTTVPVCFYKTGTRTTFIGGCTELEQYLKNKK